MKDNGHKLGLKVLTMGKFGLIQVKVPPWKIFKQIRDIKTGRQLIIRNKNTRTKRFFQCWHPGGGGIVWLKEALSGGKNGPSLAVKYALHRRQI